jgi:hypothetical protein
LKCSPDSDPLCGIQTLVKEGERFDAGRLRIQRLEFSWAGKQVDDQLGWEFRVPPSDFMRVEEASPPGSFNPAFTGAWVCRMEVLEPFQLAAARRASESLGRT